MFKMIIEGKIVCSLTSISFSTHVSVISGHGGSGNMVLEGNKYKLLSRLSLDNIEVCKGKNVSIHEMNG